MACVRLWGALLVGSVFAGPYGAMAAPVDLSLEEAIALGLKKSGLSGSKSTVGSSLVETLGVGLGESPEIRVKGGGNYLSNFEDSESGGVLLGKLRWPLYTGDLAAIRGKIYGARQSQADIGRHLSRQDLAILIAEIYLDRIESRATSQSLKPVLAKLRSLKKDIQQRAKFGAVKGSSLLEVQLKESQLMGRIREAKAHHQHAKKLLQDLVGCNADACRFVNRLTLANIDDGDSSQPNLGQQLVTQQITEIEAELHRIDRLGRPKIYMDAEGGIPPLVDRYREQNSLVDIQLVAEWDLWPSGNRRLEKARLSSKKAVLVDQMEQQRYLQEQYSKKLKEEFHWLAEKLKFLDKETRIRGKLFEAFQDEFKKGQSPPSELLNIIHDMEGGVLEEISLKIRSHELKVIHHAIQKYGGTRM